jgi:hypothetical protein
MMRQGARSRLLYLLGWSKLEHTSSATCAIAQQSNRRQWSDATWSRFKTVCDITRQLSLGSSDHHHISSLVPTFVPTTTVFDYHARARIDKAVVKKDYLNCENTMLFGPHYQPVLLLSFSSLLRTSGVNLTARLFLSKFYGHLITHMRPRRNVHVNILVIKRQGTHNFGGHRYHISSRTLHNGDRTSFEIDRWD